MDGVGDCRLHRAINRDAKDKESKGWGKNVFTEVEMKQKHHTNGQVTSEKRKRMIGLEKEKEGW